MPPFYIFVMSPEQAADIGYKALMNRKTVKYMNVILMEV